MVGPSIDEADRRVANRRLKVGFVALVTVSGGVVAAAGGATPLQVLSITLAAGVVGLALLWYLVRLGREWTPSRR
jgi:lysozyme family protein